MKAIRNGLSMQRARYIEALERVAVCRQRTTQLFDDVDVLLTPTVNGEHRWPQGHRRSPFPEHLDAIAHAGRDAADACGTEWHAGGHPTDRPGLW